MDAPVTSLELIRPWRTATLVVALVAAVELCLLVVAALILAGRSLVPHDHAAAAAAPVKKGAVHVFTPPRVHLAPVVAHLPRARVSVIVLNGNGVHGAAASAAALVTARGYKIKQVGNATHTGYPAWRVMYGPGFAGEAKRFAQDLGMSAATVGPLDGMKPKALHGAQLVLLLGASKS